MNDFTYIQRYFHIHDRKYGDINNFHDQVLDGTSEYVCNMYGSLEGLIRACDNSYMDEH